MSTTPYDHGGRCSEPKPNGVDVAGAAAIGQRSEAIARFDRTQSTCRFHADSACALAQSDLFGGTRYIHSTIPQQATMVERFRKKARMNPTANRYNPVRTIGAVLIADDDFLNRRDRPRRPITNRQRTPETARTQHGRAPPHAPARNVEDEEIPLRNERDRARKLSSGEVSSQVFDDRSR
jgi:hypothetical protein